MFMGFKLHNTTILHKYVSILVRKLFTNIKFSIYNNYFFIVSISKSFSISNLFGIIEAFFLIIQDDVPDASTIQYG